MKIVKMQKKIGGGGGGVGGGQVRPGMGGLSGGVIKKILKM